MMIIIIINEGTSHLESKERRGNEPKEIQGVWRDGSKQRKD